MNYYQAYKIIPFSMQQHADKYSLIVSSSSMIGVSKNIDRNMFLTEPKFIECIHGDNQY